MLIIPAIDLKDGCVVRLVQGKFADQKIYSRNPLETAKGWVKQGAKLLHLVDLDGAAEGEPKNLEIAKDIARHLDIPVEFGGGVRKIETIRALLAAGIQRVVIGTKAVEDKAFLKKALSEFKDKILVSIDAKEGRVAIKGWQESRSDVEVIKFALSLKAMGFRQIIYTDTLRDGTLSGPNIKGIKSLLEKTGMPIIASGGVSALSDLKKLKKLEKEGLAGVIIGKALYEGKFTLTEALKLS
jgi:phosphoribosylformimino-5-aminoimidazole carboxamide ribotide isomerase